VLENPEPSIPPSADSLAALGDSVAATDAELLRRFARRRDEDAFTALVDRHGPMVYRVCRQLLRDPADVEDAFQAVFLVLLRRAGQVRDAARLAGWLHGVAHRVAAHARAESAQRRAREGQAAALERVSAPTQETQPDVHRLVNEEVRRLPPRYRNLVVICYLEGKTNEEAAHELRCPVGTVKGRLARARELLRRRLTRRGLTLSEGLLLALLSVGGSSAGVPSPLRQRTTAEALRSVGGASTTRPASLATAAVRAERRSFALCVFGLAFLGLLALSPLAFLFVPAAGPQGQPPPTNAAAPEPEVERLRGAWRQTAVLANGKVTAIHGNLAMHWVFDGDRATVRHANRERNSTVSLDPARQPAEMDLHFFTEPKTSVWQLTYELNGDELKICQSLGEGCRRPTSVSSPPGGKNVVYILRREKAGVHVD
jgi:RNA polymerase sigma factor (sigma-70 family)